MAHIQWITKWVRLLQIKKFEGLINAECVKCLDHTKSSKLDTDLATLSVLAKCLNFSVAPQSRPVKDFAVGVAPPHCKGRGNARRDLVYVEAS